MAKIQYNDPFVVFKCKWRMSCHWNGQDMYAWRQYNIQLSQLYKIIINYKKTDEKTWRKHKIRGKKEL